MLFGFWLISSVVCLLVCPLELCSTHMLLLFNTVVLDREVLQEESEKAAKEATTQNVAEDSELVR